MVKYIDSLQFYILFVFTVLVLFEPCQASRVNFITLYKTSEDVSLDHGSIEVKPSKTADVLLVGKGLNESVFISFSESAGLFGENCNDERITKPQKLNTDKDDRAAVSLNFEITSGATYYLCIKNGESDTEDWIHQGNDNLLKITVSKAGFSLPLWLQICMIAVLMALSGLFSGLNLGLMSLDPQELKLVTNSGTSKQRNYAKKIMPVRKQGNFLLCTLLLGNTLVNATFTILLDGLTGGIVAVVGSTLAIVIFGEIVPQSICSRYGLAIGAHTIYLTKLFMVLTFPLSYPVSKLLNLILGEELGSVYNKKQLLEMLKIQDEYNDLEQDEVGIISGALKYKSKTVEEVMTSIDDCFLLDEEVILDFQTMSSIIKSGYSRIPIYSNERANIVALLFVKDLAFVDPDDCIPLLSVIKFYNHNVHKVFFDTTLDKMLEEFKQGTTHLSVVLKINDTGDGDPFYECVGIVTLEDIIEEIIQAEIVDETDVYVDNVSGKKVHRKHHNQDFALFLPAPEDSQQKLSQQLAFAIYQFLSTAVSAFSGELLSRSVLKKLIEHPGVVEEQECNAQSTYLYQKGVHSDTFTLIIQGRVEVTVGNEDIVFEDGPFSMFGITALTSESWNSFAPDYNVKLLSNKVQYLKVNRALYRSAVRATKMERDNKTPVTLQEYDEIFWKGTKSEDEGSSHQGDDLSVHSNKSTPCKADKTVRNSLIRRLTPKTQSMKSPSPNDRLLANEIGMTSQDSSIEIEPADNANSPV